MQTTLTALDRCDRCGAAARVQIELSAMPLLFCAHHYREHGTALAAQGGVITAADPDVVFDTTYAH